MWFGDRLRYCPALGTWLVWDGNRWAEDRTGEIYRLAKQTVRRIGAEVATARTDEEAKTLFRWTMKSEAKKQIDAMIGLAWSEPGITVGTGDLNRDPWSFCVRNGTINLRTGELRPHRQEDLITKLAPVTYAPDAQCPRFLAFLGQIMAGNGALVDFLQRALGYGLTADVSEHALFFFYGTGRNGKGTLLELVLSIVGDYGTTIDASLITVRRHEEHPTVLCDLDDARFVATVEVEDGKHMAEALVKKLTGGDRIKARRMRQDTYEFLPTHKIFLAANHPPEIRGTDEGIWSRIMLVPFSVYIPPEQRDRTLRDTLLRDEGPGIMAWLVRGCMEWQRVGLKPPAEVLAAVSDYKASMDAIGSFIADRCNSYLDHEALRSQAKEEKEKLYQAYADWAKADGCDSKDLLTARKFGSEMERRGYKLTPSNGRYFRTGIKLKAGDEGTKDESGRD